MDLASWIDNLPQDPEFLALPARRAAIEDILQKTNIRQAGNGLIASLVKIRFEYFMPLLNRISCECRHPKIVIPDLAGHCACVTIGEIK